jgi:hypothetical protein
MGCLGTGAIKDRIGGSLRYVIVLIAGIVSIGAAYFASIETIPQQDPLLISPLTYDLGVVKQGTISKVIFRLTNSGNASLTIANVVSRCDCTTSEVSHKILGPGETAELPVMWKIGGRRNKTSTDLLVMSTLGDKELFQTIIEITAEVDPDLKYDPPNLIFEEGQPDEKQVTFSPNVLKEVALSEASSNHRAFKAELLPGENQVRVIFDPLEWESDIGKAILSVKTNSQNEPESHIPLTVRKSRESTSGE